MRIIPSSSDYRDLTLWRIKRFADGIRDKEGMEELADPAIGPDVKYVLNTNNIELVKRYLRSPITIEEYRELRFKLLQLQLQKTTVSRHEADVNSREVHAPTVFELTPEAVLRQKKMHDGLDQKDSLIDLVA